MFQTIIGAVSSFMYSKLLVIILIGAGLYFTIRTRFPQVRLFERACESVMEKPDDKEAISSFQALMVSTASRVREILSGCHRQFVLGDLVLYSGCG